MTTMDQGARAWLFKTAKLNLWRVCSDAYDIDDLIQDGYVCWWRVVDKYERRTGRVRSRRHIMRLFQTTFANHIHDLSKLRSRAPVETKITDLVGSVFTQHEASLWAVIDTEGGDTMALERLAIEAPRPLRSLLMALLAEGTSMTLRAAFRIHRDGSRETVGERLARMIDGPESAYDYADELRLYLRA